ncbi:hypothetical protein NPX13_g4125 [Xylaria arbuscula]|uniref:CCHC-type domain-containing protein n=1 Tax=Xylaria arbuscula TaxID=114810 RepID=A0A9W8TNM4_9PEZI|nr:hypothetical protein NPX13_g4125 [Xylaria arbuscula]
MNPPSIRALVIESNQDALNASKETVLRDVTTDFRTYETGGSFALCIDCIVEGNDVPADIAAVFQDIIRASTKAALAVDSFLFLKVRAAYYSLLPALDLPGYANITFTTQTPVPAHWRGLTTVVVLATVNLIIAWAIIVYYVIHGKQAGFLKGSAGFGVAMLRLILPDQSALPSNYCAHDIERGILHMDPLTALGVAANVVQFVDFASKLIGKSKEVYNSASGASEDTTTREIIARDIARIGKSIVAPQGCSETLKELIGESDRISQELLTALGKLRIKGHKTKWKTFVVAIRGVWSEDEVEAMGTRLGKLQTQITTHLQVLISEEIAKISVALDRLRNVDITLGLKQAVERRAFKEQLVQSVENVIRKKLDEVHRSERAVPQLASHINIDKVMELSSTMSRFREELREVEAKISNATATYRVLEALYFDNIWARHDRIATAQSDTFTWIFKGVCPENDKPIEYVKWLRENHDIFWIHGKPGSGKSTLMKFLIHHPSTTTHLREWAKSTKLVVGSFFFWNSGTQLQKSQVGLLRSLLFEILRQLPDLLSGVYEAIIGDWHESQPASMSAPSHSTEVSWSLQNLLKAFKYLQSREIAAKFCFFIDGLDEYREEYNHDPRDLIKVLHNLVKSPNIKLCLSSRSWAIFMDAFGSDLNTTVKLEDLTRKDIRRFVTDSFNAHEQFHQLSLMNPLYAELVEEVVRKAQGVFLWVFLVVRDLLDGLTYNDTIKIMRQRLDRFPEDLDTYFRHIFDSIHKVYRAQTARTFQIAMSREEPLPLLYYSLVDDVEEDNGLDRNTAVRLGNEQIETKLAVMWRRLEGRSKGLLEVVVVSHTENKPPAGIGCFVDFLHRTVRDFLLHTPDIQDELMKNLQNNYQTWVLLCRATSILMKNWHEHDKVAGIEQLFYFARLAVVDSGDENIVDDVLFQVFPATKLGVLNNERINQGAGFFDIFLASRYGLTSYVIRNLPARLKLMEEAPLDDRKKKMESILGKVLHNALNSEDNYCKLSLELVEYLVSLGSSPNYLWTDQNKATDATIFYRFLSRIEKPRDIIRKYYTTDDAEWILSHAKETPARPQHTDIKDSVAQQKGDSVNSQAIDGHKPHHAHATVDNRQNGTYFPQSQIVTSSNLKGSHNKQYAVRVDNVRRQAIMDDSGKLLNGLADSLSKANNVTVVNVAWLGEKGILSRQAYGSVVVYVGSSDDVSQLLSCRMFHVNGGHGNTRAFKVRPASIQCYNCQRQGHKAVNCRNVQYTIFVVKIDTNNCDDKDFDGEGDVSWEPLRQDATVTGAKALGFLDGPDISTWEIPQGSKKLHAQARISVIVGLEARRGTRVSLADDNVRLLGWVVTMSSLNEGNPWLDLYGTLWMVDDRLFIACEHDGIRYCFFAPLPISVPRIAPLDIVIMVDELLEMYNQRHFEYTIDEVMLFVRFPDGHTVSGDSPEGIENYTFSGMGIWYRSTVTEPIYLRSQHGWLGVIITFVTMSSQQLAINPPQRRERIRGVLFTLDNRLFIIFLNGEDTLYAFCGTIPAGTRAIARAEAVVFLHRGVADLYRQQCYNAIRIGDMVAIGFLNDDGVIASTRQNLPHAFTDEFAGMGVWIRGQQNRNRTQTTMASAPLPLDPRLGEQVELRVNLEGCISFGSDGRFNIRRITYGTMCYGFVGIISDAFRPMNPATAVVMVHQGVETLYKQNFYKISIDGQGRISIRFLDGDTLTANGAQPGAPVDEYQGIGVWVRRPLDVVLNRPLPLEERQPSQPDSTGALPFPHFDNIL